MTNKHALLSASISHRWLSCPPLPRLEQFFENEQTDAALEGTKAHKLAEYKLRVALKEKQGGLDLSSFDKEMHQHTDDYVAFILETLEKVRETTKDRIEAG